MEALDMRLRIFIRAAHVIGGVGCGKNATGAVTRGQNGEEKKTVPSLFPRSYQVILCVGYV